MWGVRLTRRWAVATAVLALTASAAGVDGQRARAAPTDAEHTFAPELGLAAFGGFGAQLNQHVYADISGPPPGLDALEAKVQALRPPFVRIFFNTTSWAFPDRMRSFERTVALAHRSGAEINITLQGSPFGLAMTNMPRFADVLVGVLQGNGMSSIWVTLLNEPNSTRLTLPQYEQLYRALDAALRERAVRGRVHFMGGDLLGTTSPLGQTQVDWFRYLAARMGDLLDAWSVHIYWDFWDASKIDRRLEVEVRRIFAAIPEETRRPLYVTEFGVRGLPTFEGESGFQPGLAPDGTPLSETPEAAFEHAWFMIRAVQLSFAATVKWDLYAAKYDLGTQDHSALGPGSEGWPERPVFRVLQLFDAVTEPRGGRTVEVVAAPGADPAKLLAGYLSPAGDRTILGLDTHGGRFDDSGDAVVPYSIGGLPPSTAVRLLLWNRDGDGRNVDAGFVQTGPDGVARFSVPTRAVFALTTTPLMTLPWR